MTTPNPYPLGIDPVHVQIIAATSSAVQRKGSSVLLLARPDSIRVYLPNRSATQAARDALQRVGYQVTSGDGRTRNRGLLVSGWSAQGLQSRLDAMRAVLHKLAARPQATAAVALGQLSTIPAAELPGRTGQQHLIGQLMTGMRSWISATSGIHAPCDPRARPADPGCALRLGATRRAEQAIDDLAARQERVAQFAVGHYLNLRQMTSHERARDCILHWADLTFGLAEPAGAKTRPLAEPRRRPRNTGESAAADSPVLPVSRPPSATGLRRPRGRNFPSGRAGRRR